MFKDNNVVNNVDKTSLRAPWQNSPYTEKLLAFFSVGKIKQVWNKYIYNGGFTCINKHILLPVCVRSDVCFQINITCPGTGTTSR